MGVSRTRFVSSQGSETIKKVPGQRPRASTREYTPGRSKFVRIEGVRGSNPLSSTRKQQVRGSAARLGQAPARLDGVANQPIKLNPASTLVGRSRTMSSPATPLRVPNSSARSGPT